jgi:hypothetical protein
LQRPGNDVRAVSLDACHNLGAGRASEADAWAVVSPLQFSPDPRDLVEERSDDVTDCLWQGVEEALGLDSS